MVGAPSSERDGGLGRAGGTELVGVTSERQARRRGRLGHRRQVVERERDVLDVDVHGVGQPLGRGRGDQLGAGDLDPRRALHALRDRVAREQRHGAGLRRLVGEPAREARLAQLALDREPVPGLQLERRRPVLGHLPHERATEREDLLVGRLGEHACAPVDPALAVEVPVRHPLSRASNSSARHPTNGRCV